MGSALDGVFLFSSARRTIRCFVQRPDEAAWLDVLARRVLPRVTMLFGATTIHGASAATADGALLMLGESGAGKSTLSAFLGSRGWDILSDDISILWDPKAPKIAPSTTGVCVWSDSRAGLQLPESQCRPLAGYPGKVRYVPGGEEATEPARLKALVFLARSSLVEGAEVEPISPAEGLFLATRSRIRFNPADASGKETLVNFERLGDIVRATPCFRLHYPAHYPALPRVDEALMGILSR
jgi:hypothetical protein